MSQEIARRLLDHAAAYPALCPQDVFKFLYQGAHGCEHLLASPAAARERLLAEAATADATAPTAVTELSEGYVRVPLSYLSLGLSADTLARLFFLSARHEEGGAAALSEGLAVAEALAAAGRFPFPYAAWQAALSSWRQEGLSPVHHSEAFRVAYRPAYRVIARRYRGALPLLAAIDRHLEKGPLIMAIEGGSASGKTTLSALLSELYGATVLHTDDFFLRPEQRTPERLAEVGGGFDRERFAAEVVAPLFGGEDISLRRYDCATRTLLPPVTVRPARLTVVEGAYAMHPALKAPYGLTAFLTVTPEVQRRRILARNTPAVAARHFSEWIPREEAYFRAMRVRERCELCLAVEE